MFNKEEITAVLSILSSKGIKIDITEAEAFAYLRKRFNEELEKLNAESGDEEIKAVDDITETIDGHK